MSDPFDLLASRLGRPVAELRRLHALEGVLRRLARDPIAGRWVLRGSLVTRIYCAPWPRPVADLDFISLDPFDRERTAAALRRLLSADGGDDWRYDHASTSSEVIWQDTAFPGLRSVIPACLGDSSLTFQLDVSFHDPIVPPPRWLDYPALDGSSPRVLVCERETLIGWKAHGLFERGVGNFRPKDLHDIVLLTRGANLDQDTLREALRVAFESRGTPLSHAGRLVAGVMGRSRWSLHKWRRFTEDHPTLEFPPLNEVVAAVALALGPAFAALGVGPGGEGA